MEVFHHRGWLGHGSYGDVQLCEVSTAVAFMFSGDEDKDSSGAASKSTLIALKTWKQAHHDPKVMRIALREVQILQNLNHPNLVKLKCAFRTPSGRVCMAFNYGGNSTHQLLESRFPSGIPHSLLKRLAFQLVHAVRYLHAQKIIHRDIKPANVLVDSEGTLRLCDFGFARYTSEAAHARGTERLTPYVITRWYRAPEVLVGASYGAATDIWSLGCTLAELATGEPLLPGTSSLDQLSRITATLGPLPQHLVACMARAPQGAQLHPLQPQAAPQAGVLSGDGQNQRQVQPLLPLRQRLGTRLGAPLLELVEACLRTDSRARPSADQLLRMPYFLDAPRLFVGTPLERHYAMDRAYACVMHDSPQDHIASKYSSPPPPPSLQQRQQLQQPQQQVHVQQPRASCGSAARFGFTSGADSSLPDTSNTSSAVSSATATSSIASRWGCNSVASSNSMYGSGGGGITTTSAVPRGSNTAAVGRALQAAPPPDLTREQSLKIPMDEETAEGEAGLLRQTTGSPAAVAVTTVTAAASTAAAPSSASGSSQLLHEATAELLSSSAAEQKRGMGHSDDSCWRGCACVQTQGPVCTSHATAADVMVRATATAADGRGDRILRRRFSRAVAVDVGTTSTAQECGSDMAAGDAASGCLTRLPPGDLWLGSSLYSDTEDDDDDASAVKSAVDTVLAVAAATGPAAGLSTRQPHVLPVADSRHDSYPSGFSRAAAIRAMAAAAVFAGSSGNSSATTTAAASLQMRRTTSSGFVHMRPVVAAAMAAVPVTSARRQALHSQPRLGPEDSEIEPPAQGAAPAPASSRFTASAAATGALACVACRDVSAYAGAAAGGGTGAWAAAVQQHPGRAPDDQNQQLMRQEPAAVPSWKWSESAELGSGSNALLPVFLRDAFGRSVSSTSVSEGQVATAYAAVLSEIVASDLNPEENKAAHSTMSNAVPDPTDTSGLKSIAAAASATAGVLLGECFTTKRVPAHALGQHSAAATAATADGATAALEACRQGPARRGSRAWIDANCAELLPLYNSEEGTADDAAATLTTYSFDWNNASSPVGTSRDEPWGASLKSSAGMPTLGLGCLSRTAMAQDHRRSGRGDPQGMALCRRLPQHFPRCEEREVLPDTFNLLLQQAEQQKQQQVFQMKEVQQQQQQQSCLRTLSVQPGVAHASLTLAPSSSFHPAAVSFDISTTSGNNPVGSFQSVKACSRSQAANAQPICSGSICSSQANSAHYAAAASLADAAVTASCHDDSKVLGHNKPCLRAPRGADAAGQGSCGTVQLPGGPGGGYLAAIRKAGAVALFGSLAQPSWQLVPVSEESAARRSYEGRSATTDAAEPISACEEGEITAATVGSGALAANLRHGNGSACGMTVCGNASAWAAVSGKWSAERRPEESSCRGPPKWRNWLRRGHLWFRHMLDGRGPGSRG